jgi:tRNA(adenine34) deaminase
MALALEEARIAGMEGEVPVGAVLVVDAGVIALDHNRRDATGDPTAHAEALVLRAAGSAARDWRLDRATLYVTLEPCAMCAAAAVLARIDTVVFGASDPVAGAAGSAYNVLEDGRLGHAVRVIGGVMEEECGTLLREFFGSRR